MPDIEPVVLPSFSPISQRAPAASPFQFFLTGAENLQITTFNSQPGVNVRVLVRFLGDASTVQWQQYDHTPNADRSKKTTSHPLGRGYVLNVVAFATSGAPRIGQAFVQVKLIGGLSGAVIKLGTLLQGYVTESQELAWPGSPIQSSIEGGGVVRIISYANPAIGAPFSAFVPTGARWELMCARLNFSPDATVVTRYVQLAFKQGALYYFISPSGGGSPTGVTYSCTFAQAMGPNTAGATTRLTAALGVGATLLAGDEIEVAAIFGTVGDRFTVPVLNVREWLEGE